MLVPCEIAVKSVIPAIRAYLAKELTQTYEMKQTDVAVLLGITQTAISKYVRDVRGRVIRVDQILEIKDTIDELASQVANKKISGSQLTLRLCQVCKTLRQNGYMCDLCKRYDPTLNVKTCSVCKS